jgi:LPXTG-motif cell wall-anchored protein
VNARKLQSTKEKQLPQTGSNNNDGLVLLGLALFPLSLTSVYQNKRKF